MVMKVISSAINKEREVVSLLQITIFSTDGKVHTSA